MDSKELDNCIKRLRIARCTDLININASSIVLINTGEIERNTLEIICHEMIELGRELERSTLFEVALAVSPKKKGKK